MFWESENELVIFFCILIPFLLLAIFFSLVQKERRKRMWVKKRRILRAWKRFILQAVAKRRKDSQ
jgi:hypothetical protein